MSLTLLEETVKDAAKKHNSHFTMIDGMSKLMTEKVKKFESSDFQGHGLKWASLIRSDFEKNHLSYYLWITDKQCVGTNWEVRCSYKLILIARAGPDVCKTFTTVFNQKGVAGGDRHFISHLELKERFLINDIATFGVEITDVRANFSNISSIPRAMGTAERVKLIEVARQNSRFTWKITQFSSFNGISHSSYEFTVGPRTWRLRMYPKGDKTGVEHLSLFLTATDYVTNGPKAKTLAVYKLRVLDQRKRNHYETNHENWFDYDPNPLESSWGKAKFLSLEELYNPSRGLLVNDEIYIGVEFLLVSNTEYL